MTKVFTQNEVWRRVLLSIIIFGILEVAVLYWGFPEYYTNNVIFIPIYFLALGISLLLAIYRINSKPLHIGRAAARLMLLNASQLVLSFGVLFYYIRYIDVQRRSFVLLFGLFYIWFLLLKLFVFYNIDSLHNEKKKLEKQKRENETLDKK